MSLILVGLSRSTADLGLLERVSLEGDRLSKALDDLVGGDNLSEAVVISTCLRTEVVAIAERFHQGAAEIRDVLARYGGIALDELGDSLFAYFEESAVAHLFRVAAGLDSAVPGEGEVLAQVRGAWEQARSAGAAGPRLDAVFRHAVEAGKRVRSETAIARGVTSLSQAALSLGVSEVGGLDGRSVLLVGAGQMGQGILDALAGRRRDGVPADVVVCSRSEERAGTLVHHAGARWRPFAEVVDALVGADLVLCQTSSPDPVLSRELVERVMAARPERPLVVVDLAMPRDVDPEVASVPGVRLLDLDALVDHVSAEVADKRREAEQGEVIVREEVGRFGEIERARSATPAVAALHRRAEAIRRTELERFGARARSLDADALEAVDALSRAIVRKLLHEPTVQLKRTAGSPKGERLADALRVLFDLDEP